MQRERREPLSSLAGMFGSRLWQWLAGMVLGPVAVGVVMAGIGPFGTFSDLDLPHRLIYWVVIVWLNWLQVTLCAYAAERWLPAEWPRAAPLLVAAAAASVPATAEVFVLETLMRPQLRIESILGLYFWVLVVSVALTLAAGGSIRRLWRAPMDGGQPSMPTQPALTPSTPGQAAPQPDPGPAAADPASVAAAPAASDQMDPLLLRRLPPGLGTDLLAIGAEEHYLRVYTGLGDTLILMRLADAVEQLGALDGLQVHRSWWVARSAVDRIERDDARVTLHLRNGLSVPVSRARVAAVKQAGWPIE